MAGPCGLLPAAVSGLLRLFVDGHRRGGDAGLPAAPELRASLRRPLHAGLLAPLAHQSQLLVPGLCVYPAGRQQKGGGPYLPEPAGGVAVYGPVARQYAELPAVGTVPLCPHLSGTSGLGQGAPAQSGDLPALYAPGDPPKLDALRHPLPEGHRQLPMSRILCSINSKDSSSGSKSKSL